MPLKEIFNRINKKDNKSLKIYCNFIEINNEEIYDLLSNEVDEEENSNKKKIHLIENSNNYYLEQVNYLKLDDYNKVKDIIRRLIKIIDKDRNLSSSLLFKIIILNDRDFSKIDLVANDFISLTFVDLGSKEKLKGDYLRKQNQSIYNLEKCLQILKFNKITKDKKLVPFKDSVLTKIVSGYFLSKNTNINLICNINPIKNNIIEAIYAIKISCLYNDTKLNKSNNSKNSINSNILDDKEKSKIKSEKENNQGKDEPQINILNNFENVKKEILKIQINLIILILEI